MFLMLLKMIDKAGGVEAFSEKLKSCKCPDNNQTTK